MDKLKPLEHKIKASFFWLFKIFLKIGIKEFKPLDANKLKKVLFLRPEKIGDMVISFPVFDGLKKYYPNIDISILGSPKNIALIKNDKRFDKIFLYTKSLFKDINTFRKMRSENYDCVVDMICDDSVTALFISQIVSKGKPRIGVGKIKYQKYYDFNYDHRMGNTGHIIENTLKLLEAFNINSSEISGYAIPYVDEQADNEAKQFVSSIKDSNNSKLIGYNLSAGSPTRIWRIDKSISLVRSIIQSDMNSKVILFTTPNERKRGEKILSELRENVYLVPDNLTLIQATAMIKYLDILISPDTSLVHIARSFKVQVIGLYSRFMKNFLLWKPYGQEGGAIVSGNDDNIHDITANQVFEEYLKLANNISSVGKR